MAGVPDFKSAEERDLYFMQNADYFTLFKQRGFGTREKSEYKTLEAAEKAAQTKKVIGGGGYMIYAVIGEQSAFVKSIK
jgi:hypothetical protein